MRAQFVRGANTKSEILDKILNRKITLELQAPLLILDQKGNIDIKDEDSKYLLSILKKNKIRYNIENTKGPRAFQKIPVLIVSGTKEQLIPLLTLWDPYGRSEIQLRRDLKNWEGNENQLWEILS